MASAAATFDAVKTNLDRAGQGHLLAFYARLSGAEQAALLAQCAALDLAGLSGLIEKYVKAKPAAEVAGAIEPAHAYGLDGTVNGKSYDRAGYLVKGEALIRSGKAACFTVAGGQGSRLGYDGPKGCYPGGSVSGKPLFACIADWILAVQQRYGSRIYGGGGLVIPWYIMTSPQNHEATVAFFRQHRFFGLAEADVMFFPQGVMPSMELGTGRILLSSPGEIGLNPDGHGGSLKALWSSGAIADMERRGVEEICYTQIDNPLVRAIDPLFLGLHRFAPDSSGEMSSKMVRKAHAGEKVGVLCKVGGKTAVVEYSDMPEELSKKTNADGRLTFDAGSIAVHVISVAFVRKLNAGAGGFSLPYHRAEKKVAHADFVTGQPMSPEKPNAIKLETFVFDALPLCEGGRSIVLETDRVDEFAPIKNAEGADSPATCRQIQTRRAANWLAKAGQGGVVPMNAGGEPDCVLELPPTTALYPEDLRGLAVAKIAAGEKRVL